MKLAHIVLSLLLLVAACKKEAEPEMDKHFRVLKEEILRFPYAPVNFYWVDQPTNTPLFATACLNTQVQFDPPYVLANGIKFHIDNWLSTQHITDKSVPRGQQVQTEVRFYPPADGF